MIDFPLLSLIVFLPLVGVLFIATLRGAQADVARNARYGALITSGMVFVLTLLMFSGFDPSSAGFQFVEKASWLPALGLSYHMGVDGISVYFVLLSAFLTLVCVVSAWQAVQVRVRDYMIAFLVLETFMLGTFCALDTVLFYVFFEGSLLPMFLIIGVWGGERRVYSAYKFFLYTLLGSVFMLVGILAMAVIAGTTDIPTLMEYPFSKNVQFWLWLAFFASFAVKMPMWPVHTWLPDAHVEAPTAGSVILAGVLLKMGGYGFLRFSLPMLPEASLDFAPLVFALSIVAFIYASLIALVQEDIKKMIAYSSVAHMGFVTLGIFTLTPYGIQGGIFQMLSHGLISAALFLCVGVLYDRMHTRSIRAYRGMVNNMPRYAVVFMILMLGSVGLPGTSGFVGEFLALLGAFQVSTFVALMAGTGIVLGAVYMLNLYRHVVFGPPRPGPVSRIPDLTVREGVMFLPLVVLVLLYGVFPGSVLNTTNVSVMNLVDHVQARLNPGEPLSTPSSLDMGGVVPVAPDQDNEMGH